MPADILNLPRVKVVRAEAEALAERDLVGVFGGVAGVVDGKITTLAKPIIATHNVKEPHECLVNESRPAMRAKDPSARGVSVVSGRRAGFSVRGRLLRDRKGGDPDERPEDLRVREFPDG